jgi:hypothetical protein
LKIDQDILRTQYRQSIRLDVIDLEDQNISSKIIQSVVPYKIDKQLDQTIREISIIDCKLTDASLSMLIEILMKNTNALYYLNLSTNKLTIKSIKPIANFLESLDDSKDLEHLILDNNMVKTNNGLVEMTNSLV